jgi:UDP-N-acetylmuramoyl-tripeptide--D-alanyl-D-alanine ligase
MLTLAEAQRLLPGSTLVGDGQVRFERVHSDSRSLQAGDLFVALQGERFDGHDFLPQARAAGAVAALAERGLAEAGLPGLQVADALQALQQLAAAWRQRFHLPLIAVTGSNGKTTVTQMTASILRAWLGAGAFATEGNLNNHIGLPLTLLRLRQDGQTWHRAGVVELGMNHPGEIALLARLAQPTIALVNNAQREHQEFMESVEAVARENGSAIEALPASGTAVFPADDAQVAVWREQAGSRATLTFALDASGRFGADVTAEARWQDAGTGGAGTAAAAAAPGHWAVLAHTPAGEVPFELHVAGLHNVRNALAAATCALAAGAPLSTIRQGLEAFAPVRGRSHLSLARLHGREVTLIDDSYNANPDSVLAAIDVLAGLPGPRWLVLGDMGEVGSQGPAFHAEVGAHARERALEHVWCVGALCAETAAACGPAARHFDTVQALLAHLAEAPAAASVLVKGSRFMAMERVVRALQAAPAAPAPGGGDAA